MNVLEEHTSLARSANITPQAHHAPAGRTALLLRSKRKETLSRVSLGSRQLPIFPGRLQPSIVGVCALNFCVRDGNRWNRTA